MMLKSSTAVSYPKFRKLGDSVTGDFVSYQEDVPSRFGNENLLTLQGDAAKLIIRTPTNLSRTLRQNLDSLAGKRLTITFTSELPSKKGNPVKVFTVDAVDVRTATSSTGTDIGQALQDATPEAVPPAVAAQKVE